MLNSKKAVAFLELSMAKNTPTRAKGYADGVLDRAGHLCTGDA